MLKTDIQNDLEKALKAGQRPAIDALRMLKTAIIKFEVAGTEKKEATDAEIIQLVQKECKSRQESAELYQKGDRPELQKKELAEIEVLKKYLPPQMNEAELRTLIKEVISEIGATSKADMGKVMAALMPKVKGKADGGTVNRLTGEMLS